MRKDEFKSTAVLIDFENFFLGREQQLYHDNPGSSYHDEHLMQDLRTLLRFCNQVSNNTVRVCRAYSDFTARREASPLRAYDDPRPAQARYDYFLTRTPRSLIELGIEPIQVFRYSSTPGATRTNKNAVDIRIAMDASALCRGTPIYDLLILVSGDSDFIPVVVDCRRHGTRVFGIGVGGATNRNLEEFCDRFEYFSELEASVALEDAQNTELKRVIAALQTILRTHPRLPAAAVRPELNHVLETPFDPTPFGCRTTSEFLREFRADLSASGILVDRSPEGWSVTLAPEPCAATEPEASEIPSVDDDHGTGSADGSADPGDSQHAPGTNGNATNRASVAENLVAHAMGLRPGRGVVRAGGTNYRQLLQIPPVRYYVYPKAVWLAAAEIVIRAARETTGGAPAYDDLVAVAKDMGADTEVPPLALTATAYGLCAARSLVPVEQYTSFRRVDRYFHWRQSPEIEGLDVRAAAENAFARFVNHLAQEVRQRLNLRPSTAREEIDPERLAALWSEDDPTPEEIETARRAIEALAPQAPTPTATPRR